MNSRQRRKKRRTEERERFKWWTCPVRQQREEMHLAFRGMPARFLTLDGASYANAVVTRGYWLRINGY